MKILLVNDDGFSSDGIKTLDEELTHRGHEVWVCAPESQRSGFSHAIHLKNVRIDKVSERHYVCDGFPADCVLYPLLGAIPVGMPDVVISGINQGFNISTDVQYSGTVGAASDGALHKICSIAVSCEKVDRESLNETGIPSKRVLTDYPFKEAACFVADHLEELYKNYRVGTVYNINVPDDADGKWISAVTGLTDYGDSLTVDRQKGTFGMDGAPMPTLLSENVEGTDFYTVFAKKLISVAVVEIAI